MGKLGGGRFISLVVVTLLVLSLFPSAMASEERIGVLMIGFGEPEEYNADAYIGWENFILNYMSAGMRMMNMSFMYPIVRDIMIPSMDAGTILVDRNDPFATEPKEDPDLIDAWTNPYAGEDYEWVEIPEGEFPMMGPLYSYYLSTSTEGPGMGESDFWEYFGLMMYGLYQYMDNHNPGGERENRILNETEARLKAEYGDEIIIRRGYGAARPGYPDFRVVAEEMVREEEVTDLILAEAYVCFSEFEHPASEIEEHLKEEGLDVNIAIADQIGGTESFSEGVAKKVEGELRNISKDADVVVFLSHHGMFNLNMLIYDWREEPYHEYAKIAFDGAEEAIYDLDVVKDWEGEFDVWQAYAEFVEGMSDPENEILSVEEAADKASEQGYEYCIDVPYEVGNSGFETLIGLRGCWGIDPPTWDTYYEDELIKYRSTTEYNGMNVVITDGWIDGAIDGYYEQISEAIEEVKP
jgi:hypothetical protein